MAFRTWFRSCLDKFPFDCNKGRIEFVNNWFNSLELKGGVKGGDASENDDCLSTLDSFPPTTIVKLLPAKNTYQSIIYYQSDITLVWWQEKVIGTVVDRTLEKMTIGVVIDERK